LNWTGERRAFRGDSPSTAGDCKGSQADMLIGGLASF
jgi:hypothetical protein